MRINEIIACYIKNNGVKQSYISEATGINKNALSSILKGKRKMSADEFLKIILLLNIEIGEFIKCIPNMNIK